MVRAHHENHRKIRCLQCKCHDKWHKGWIHNGLGADPPLPYGFKQKTNSNIGTHNDTTTKSNLNFLKMAVSCHLKIGYAPDRWTHPHKV